MKYDIINPKHYFSLIDSNNELNESDKNSILDFETYVATLMEYEDYLLEDQKNILKEYKQKIINLAYIEESGQTLNSKQSDALNKYNTISTNILNKNNDKVRKLEKENMKKEVSTGYINAFVVLLTVLAAGIFIGLTIFMIIK